MTVLQLSGMGWSIYWLIKVPGRVLKCIQHIQIQLSCVCVCVCVRACACV